MVNPSFLWRKPDLSPCFCCLLHKQYPNLRNPGQRRHGPEKKYYAHTFWGAYVLVKMSGFCAVAGEGFGDLLRQRDWTPAQSEQVRGSVGSAGSVCTVNITAPRVSILSCILYFYTVFLYFASWGIKPHSSLSRRPGGAAERGVWGAVSPVN